MSLPLVVLFIKCITPTSQITGRSALFTLNQRNHQSNHQLRTPSLHSQAFVLQSHALHIYGTAVFIFTHDCWKIELGAWPDNQFIAQFAKQKDLSSPPSIFLFLCSSLEKVHTQNGL